MSSAPHPSPAWIFSGKAQCKLLQQLVSYLNKNLHYEVHYRRYRYRRNKKNESSSVCLEICQALKNIQLCGIHQFTIHNYTIQQCTVHVYINYISFFACHYSCINYIYIYIYIYTFAWHIQTDDGEYSLHRQVFYEIDFSKIMLNMWLRLFSFNKAQASSMQLY